MRQKFAYISLIYIIIGLLSADLVLDQTNNKAYSFYNNGEDVADISINDENTPDINEIIYNTIHINPQATLNIAELNVRSNDVLGLGPGYGKDFVKLLISQETKDYLKSLNSYCIGSPGSNKNYITFDVGDDRGYIEQILNTLKDKNVKAVFFITKPYIDNNKDLVRRMIDEGHIVGNHSVSHFASTTITLDELQSEVMDLHRQMLEEYNYEMYLFRFPYGDYSDRSLAAINELGYITMFWSFVYTDYDPTIKFGEDYAHDIVVNNAHNGAIYLFHAVSEDAANALPRIIDTLREQGYELSLLEEEPE